MRRNHYAPPPVEDIDTILLLHGNEFVDASTYEATVTNVNSVQISNDGKFDKAFYWPASGAGSQGWIDCVVDTNNRITNGVFTIDFWAKMTNTSKTYKVLYDLGDHFTQYFDASENNKYTLLNNGNGINSNWNNGAKDHWGVGGSISTCLFVINTWAHIAVVGDGSTIKIYKNGVFQVCSTPTSGIVNYVMSMLNGKVRIGNINYPGLYRNFRGYISEFRFSKVARWTENFTPPTEPYL